MCELQMRQSVNPDPQDFFVEADGRRSCSVTKFVDTGLTRILFCDECIYFLIKFKNR